MNRRAFLQSVIAVPLVAVGMPRVQAPFLGHGAYPHLRAALAAADLYDWRRRRAAEHWHRRMLADHLARRIDEDAFRHAMSRV